MPARCRIRVLANRLNKRFSDAGSIGVTMPAEDKARSIHHRLVSRIRQGPGRAPADQRAQAFDNVNLPEPLRGLLDKVATRSAQVTDADFATAIAAGFTDEQLFELVICAAVGESTRQYEAGLRALAEAIADTEAP
jgi:hypothetical protein